MIDSFIRDGLPPPELQPDFLFTLPELHYPERLNAAVELIDRHDPDALAVINDAGSWTYGEMKDLSERIARLLVEREGLVPGNRVLLRGPNNAMLFASWLGVLRAGGIVVATMPMLRPGEIATIVERAQVSHAIVDARFREDFDAAGGTRSVLSYDGDKGFAGLDDVAPGFTPVDTHRDDVAPDAFARHILKPEPGDRWACSAPIAFTFGLGMLLIFPWRFGGTAVTIETPGPKPLLDAIERHKVTMLATAPTAYKAMIPMLGAHDIASLRTCVSAGEHLPAATWHAWRDATEIAIVDGIGATEMMHVFISAAGEDIRPGATGRAVPGYVAAVLDEAGAPIEEGTGRLAVKGPTGCRYFDDERQADYVQHGWNVTGDTYRKDGDGYFWYVARSDDMIISAGYNIAAPEVENALYAHPAVQECAVVGAPCPERGQKVKAFVVLAAGHAADSGMITLLQNHVKAAIAPYKYPREIEFVAALPKTATGKLQRFALREG